LKDSSGTPLLVVVGEASGDALAAPVVSALGVAAFGIGGPGLEAAGTELVTDFANLQALGIRSALGSVPALTLALANLVRATRARRPRAALLVGFSEVNARIASWLRRRRVKVLW